MKGSPAAGMHISSAYRPLHHGSIGGPRLQRPMHGTGRARSARLGLERLIADVGFAKHAKEGVIYWPSIISRIVTGQRSRRSLAKSWRREGQTMAACSLSTRRARLCLPCPPFRGSLPLCLFVACKTAAVSCSAVKSVLVRENAHSARARLQQA
jgi:hypothetical protein